MNARLKNRLDRIERAMWQPTPPEECPSPAQYFDRWLAARGIDPGPNESRAETTARAMGISYQELRAELLQAASEARFARIARPDGENRR
jgi:hypothetical protein